MSSTPSARRSLLASLLLSLSYLAAGPVAGAGDTDFDPARVGWSEVRMSARKLFLTATARLTLRSVPGANVKPDMLAVTAAGFTPLAPGPDVLEMVYAATGAGRVSEATLLMDPRSGAALQKTTHDQQGKQRFRTYRFGQQGAYQRTRWPATDSERTLLPARWTKTSEGLRTYPVPPGRQPVVEPIGLLYAIAAAPLDKPGDVIEVLVFRRRDTQLVRIEVLAPRQVSIAYDEVWPKGTVQRRGNVLPLRLSLRGLPVPGSKPEDDDLELLGLRGRLELLLDPVTRAPLELSGDVKMLGAVTLRLTALRPR